MKHIALMIAVGALLVGALVAPAQAGDIRFGRVWAADKVLREGCHGYQYQYVVRPGSHDWALETFLHAPSGRTIASGGFHFGNDPKRGDGRFRFCNDVTRPGQAHACMVRSPHAHAAIEGIDTADALKVPGVLAVLTGADAARDGVGLIPHPAVPTNPHEVPLNFLNPRPGTPFGDLPLMESADALRTIAAFRLAMPRTVLRYAGGRELTLGDLGTRDGLLGGINAVIVGNYLTTLGRDADEDLALLSDLKMPIKELAKTL